MNSQASEILSLILNLTGNIEKEFDDRLPRKIGVLAKQHFRDNFRKSGFVDGGVRPWQKAQREGGTSTSSRYRTLTSSRNHLMNSIEAIPAKGSVLVYNPVLYSGIHNEGGGMLSFPNVTPKMRRFFWAKYFNAGGKKGGEEAEKWKRIALGAKDVVRIKFRMPKRQFIGESKELREKIDQEFVKAIERLTAEIKTK